MFNIATASNGESAKEVILRKCLATSLAGGRTFVAAANLIKCFRNLFPRRFPLWYFLRTCKLTLTFAFFRKHIYPFINNLQRRTHRPARPLYKDSSYYCTLFLENLTWHKTPYNYTKNTNIKKYTQTFGNRSYARTVTGHGINIFP